MLRFEDCIAEELRARGVDVTTVFPRPVIGRLAPSGGAVQKWTGYVDKYVLFPRMLRRHAQASDPDTVYHICDHSAAMYTRNLRDVPNVVTCHDLLAVRGALGDKEAFCEASALGRRLQRWILKGLAAARFVVCDSQATANDLARLVPPAAERSSIVPLSLNRPYKRLSARVVREGLQELNLTPSGYILNVGSSLPRKNREGCLQVMHCLKDSFPGNLVFAGQWLHQAQRGLQQRLGLGKRVVELGNVSDEQLEVLYNGAHALLFPSYAEGFGWPILEAQSCGCPVVCSDRTSIPEVAGRGAFVQAAEDNAGFARSLTRLLVPEVRSRQVRLGDENVAQFSAEKMVTGYLRGYQIALGST